MKIKECLKPPALVLKGRDFPPPERKCKTSETNMPLKPPSSFAKPCEAGQLRKQRVKGKCWVQSPFQMGGRAPSRKSTRKNYTPKNNQRSVFIECISHFTWLFEGGSLNTAVGAGPLHPNVDLPTMTSLDFFGLSMAYR